MRYASIDIETLGLDADTCDVIEFGAVLDNLEDQKPLADLPTFHAYILPYGAEDEQVGIYRGEPYAMSMHATILRRIAKRDAGYQYLRPHELGSAFREFLTQHDYGEFLVKGNPKLAVAGKNFASFDRLFLDRMGFFEQVPVAHRCFDPGSLYARKDDEKLPNTETCCQRAHITDHQERHDAVYDALTVVKLIRHAINSITPHVN